MFQRSSTSRAARRLLAVVATSLCIVAVSAVQVSTAAAETPAAVGDLGVVGSYILIDADTGLALASKNERTALPVASLTKILTALVAVDRLEAGSKIPVSAEAASMPARRMGMQVGQQWLLEDAMYSMLLASANDVAYAVGEAAGGGTMAGFANQLSVVSSRLGLADKPVLKDPSGLDDNFSVDGGNLISARDLAIAGRAALANKRLAPIMATQDYMFKDPTGATRQLSNHNKLLADYTGTTGLKTGFTDKAGRCLMASATRNGRTMIVVVLDTPGMWDVAPQLMDYGFSIPQAVEPTVDRLPAPPGISNLVIASETTTTVAVTTPTDAGQVDIGDAVTIEKDAEAAADPEGEATQTDEVATSESGSNILATLVKAIGVLLIVAVVLLRTRAVLRRKRRKQRQLIGSAPTQHRPARKRIGRAVLAQRAARNAQASTQVIAEMAEMMATEDEAVVLRPTANDDRYDVVEVHASVRQAHGLVTSGSISSREDADVVVVDASDDWNNDTNTDTYRRPRL